MKLVFVIVALVLSTSLAQAGNKAAADACYSQLAAGPRQIYDLIAREVKPDSDIKALLVSKLRPLVMSGKLDRATANADGASAATCLAVLQ